jgi:biopolymer transport protein ExbD
MKTTAMVILSILIFVSCQQSSVDIPEPITKSVKDLYPNAQEINWSVKDGEYESQFKVDEKEIKLLLDEKGKVLESEIEIDVEELPQAVKQVLEERFDDLEVDEVVRIEKEDIINYEVEFEIMFAEDGSMLTEEDEEENGD